MKFLKFLAVLSCFFPIVSFGAGSSDFQNASQLLMAARSGDTQTVQFLVSSGADINYTDSTGLSLVCTAVMNNDRRAIQILQMYGADASQCDKQIKKYKQRSKVAAKGEDYNFFSGLSSSHVIVLSAVAVAGVIGGVALLTDAFKAKNGNHNSPSGGSHSGGGGGGSSSGSVTKDFTIPYGPAYLNSEGDVDTSFDLSVNLSTWDNSNGSEIRKTYFNYLRTGTDNNFLDDGLVSTLQNYLLTMRGYYSFASGYMGQKTFRNDDKSPQTPKLTDVEGSLLQGVPVRVGLITGNGINPSGSADSGTGIMYAINNTSTSATPIVDKYINNKLVANDALTEYTETEKEIKNYDLSGSGTTFNIYANVNDSALAKIVAGWEAGGENSSSVGDLYGFVPNGQLAIYRTGNGTIWNVIENATDKPNIGVFVHDEGGNSVLSEGDIVEIDGVEYKIYTALSQTTITQPTLTVGKTIYKLPATINGSKQILDSLFVGKCGDDCDSIAIYVDEDGIWYVNSEGGENIDSVYIADSGKVYEYKTQDTNSAYLNFSAMSLAAHNTQSKLDLIANVNVLPSSRNLSYLTVNSFENKAKASGSGSLMNFYNNQITSYYGGSEGGVAHNLFYNNADLPMIIMPAGDKLYKDGKTGEFFIDDLSATFENYAPMIYGGNLKHNFMTIVAVSHEIGTSAADTISGYGDGTGSNYGPIVLSKWGDEDSNVYSSRTCGIAGKGNSSKGIDPWCFAAAGPTAEMATAAAAGAVASVKSAFSYMTDDQIFTLLALTADGPYLATIENKTILDKDELADALASYLQGMYDLQIDITNMTSSEYLEAFKDVFGYGLINLERAIKPGYSIYYYSKGSIENELWGNIDSSSSSSSSSRSSSALSLSGRSAVKISYYDMLQSTDGSLSLPRVWSDTIAFDNTSKHGLYMGDVLVDFNVDNSNKHTNKIGKLTFDMSMSDRAYNDRFNGLDNLRVAFTNDKLDIDAQYQHYLTGGESRFDGRANNLLALTSNAVSSGAAYKVGKFSFGSNAFFGSITEESLLETDPVVSNQFEPGRLGFANGVSFDAKYNNDKFGLGVSFGTMHENNTVLGSLSSGLLALNGADTQYVDVLSVYKPMEKVKLSLRGTFANTKANVGDGIISELSNIKSNAFAFGADVGGFSFTAAMPLATVSGRMGYGYADFNVVENDGKYSVVMENAHTEYIDLSHNKRELRFTTNYKRSVGQFTDAGLGFIYRVNPNNTDAFGNESVFMFKIHHRLGI